MIQTLTEIAAEILHLSKGSSTHEVDFADGVDCLVGDVVGAISDEVERNLGTFEEAIHATIVGALAEDRLRRVLGDLRRAA